MRYIHLNPYRAKICTTIEELDHYPWSGHAVILGTRQALFQDVATVVKRFSGSRERYHAFIREGITTGSDEGFIATIRQSNTGRENVHNAGCWVIGDQEFVREVMSSDANRRAHVARYQKEGFDISSLAKKSAVQWG